MKNIFLSILLFLSSTIVVNASEYDVQGDLSSGKIESIVTHPTTYASIEEKLSISPNFRGSSFTFYIDVKSFNVKNNARLWIICHDTRWSRITKVKGPSVIRGSNNWNRYNVKINNIPNNTSHISFGVELNGVGKVTVKNADKIFK